MSSREKRRESHYSHKPLLTPADERGMKNNGRGVYGDELSQAVTTPWGLILGLFSVAIFIIVLLVIFNTSQKPAGHFHPNNETLGGIYPETASTPFVSTYDIGLLNTVMIQITNGCTPPISPSVDPIYNVLKIGTLASTRASWAQYKSTFNGTGAGQCVFYGLEELELRSGQEEGPADLCHAYISAGLQYLAVNNLTGPQQANLFGNLDIAVQIAFPLSMYWRNSLGLNWDVTLALALQGIAQQFISGVQRNVQVIATTFCNPYFASDQPNYYNSVMMSHLAFPYEGMVNRMAKSLMIPGLESMLGQLDIPPGLDIKKVYIIDNLAGGNPNNLETDAGVLLFIQSMIAGSGAPTILLNMPVADALTNITQSIYFQTINSISIDPAQVPVLVIARYTDDPQSFQTYRVPASTVMFAFSPDDPNDILRKQYLGIVLQNAIATASMSIFDFDEQWPFEVLMGDAFAPEKAVSDFINLLIGTYVFAGTTGGYGLLDTFAIKDTLVAGVDVGGWFASTEAQGIIDAEGISLGMKRHPFATELLQSVGTPSNTSSSSSFGNSDPPAQLPASFDWRANAPQCLTPVVDQGVCPCCWAVSAAHAMASRICIHNGASISSDKFLSVQQIVTCSKGVVTNDDGCHPQQPSVGFSFMQGDVTTDQCQPFASQGSTAGGCQTVCNQGGAPPLAGGIVGGSYRMLQTPDNIKAELMNGPIAIAITIPTNFFSFFPKNGGTPGVDTNILPVTSTMQFMKGGGHMMVLLGWDDTTSPPCWIVQNSWGRRQGNNGVLRIGQDVDELLRGKVPWIDYFGFSGQPRIVATDPVTVLLNQGTPPGATTTNIGPGSQARIYTATITCPNQMVNTQQANQSAAIQGCPNSAQNFVSSPASQSVHAVSNEAFAIWSISIIMVTLALLLLFV